jgi:hypothetical protein
VWRRFAGSTSAAAKSDDGVNTRFDQIVLHAPLEHPLDATDLVIDVAATPSAPDHFFPYPLQF